MTLSCYNFSGECEVSIYPDKEVIIDQDTLFVTGGYPEIGSDVEFQLPEFIEDEMKKLDSGVDAFIGGTYHMYFQGKLEGQYDNYDGTTETEIVEFDCNVHRISDLEEE